MFTVFLFGFISLCNSYVSLCLYTLSEKNSFVLCFITYWLYTMCPVLLWEGVSPSVQTCLSLPTSDRQEPTLTFESTVPTLHSDLPFPCQCKCSRYSAHCPGVYATASHRPGPATEWIPERLLATCKGFERFPSFITGSQVLLKKKKKLFVAYTVLGS